MKNLITFLFLATSLSAFSNEIIFYGHRTDVDSTENLKCIVQKTIEYGSEYIAFEIEPTKQEKKYYTYFQNLGFYKFGPFKRGALKFALEEKSFSLVSKNEHNFKQSILTEKKIFSDELNIYLNSSLDLFEENLLNFADNNSIVFKVNNSKITSLELSQSLQEPKFRGSRKYHRSICIQD